MKDLVLYHFDSCPYCAKVRDYLDENNISIQRKDIRKNSEFREELLKIAGKGQVPCLVIDGEPMHESNDIIEWFKQHNVDRRLI